MKTDNTIFEQLTDVYLLALCIWAEARSQGLEGMQAVGSVILNRAARPGWWGKDVKSVILAPKQFSSFNEDDPQRALMITIAQNFIDTMLRDSSLRACVWVAAGLVGAPALTFGWTGRFLPSNVGAATHYHTEAPPPGVKIWPPVWANKMTRVNQIKAHIFYEEAHHA